MKKILETLLVIVLFFLSASVKAESISIYVSPNGNDKNSGTLQQPMKTVYSVQRKVKQLVRESKNLDIVVYFKDGRYQFNNTLVLGFKDVARNGSLTFKAYKDANPVFASGELVKNWIKVKKYPKGTPAVAKGHLFVTKIPNDIKTFRVLFDGDHKLVRAKSQDFSVPDINKNLRLADSQNTYYNKDRIYLRMFPFTDQIKDWDNLGDVELVFNPVPWNMNLIGLESVDMKNHIAYLKYEANSIPSGSKSWARVENVIDYLDEPGEWCVNTKSKNIYYWPKSGKPSDEIRVPKLMELVRVEGKIQYDLQNDIPVKNIHFDGITFSEGDRTVWYKNRKGWGIQHDWDTFDYGNAMLRFRGARDCSVTNCKFINSGGDGVRLDLYCQNINVSYNSISHIGQMGIILIGYGPGTKDVNKNNIISNNEIHDCGDLVWHGHAIFLWQSGENKITHNYIHDVPRKAIGIAGVRCQILNKSECNFDEASRTIRWNEIEATIDSSKTGISRYERYLHARNNIISNNKVERTLLKLSDGASINVSGAGFGNVVCHNFLYDIPHVGIRTDDWQDGTTIKDNIIVNANTGVIHKGVTSICNNIFINCKRGIHFRAYPQQYFVPKSDIQHNIFYNSSAKFQPYDIFKWGRMYVHVAGKKSIPYEYQMDNNCYYFDGAETFLKEQQRFGIEKNSVIENPKFKNLDKKDYIIKNKKLIKNIGFEVFDCSLDCYGIEKKIVQHKLK